MSDGKKAAYEEEQLEANRAHLERLAKLTPEQLATLYDRLERSLVWFKPETPLTYAQHQAIEIIRGVARALRTGVMP